MKLTDYEALSFDCDGTLIDWEAGIAAVLNPWATRRGLSLDAEQLLTEYSAHEATAEVEHLADLHPDILARSIRALGAELGAEVSDADAAALANSVPDWSAFEDSHDALNALGKYFQLIILSNVDRASFGGSNASLGVEFRRIITAEDVGSYKPSARDFDALAAETRRLGIGEGKLLHVAQSLFHDHLPAKRVGVATVWINRRHDRPGWGATPAPPAAVTPDWQFPSMAVRRRRRRRVTHLVKHGPGGVGRCPGQALACRGEHRPAGTAAHLHPHRAIFALPRYFWRPNP